VAVYGFVLLDCQPILMEEQAFRATIPLKDALMSVMNKETPSDISGYCSPPYTAPDRCRP
jgi:hypothetical protein